MTESRRAFTRQAEKVLTSLLRSPKTRAGLITAVHNKHISRNFVYGYLTEQTRTGKVAVLKSGVAVMYQLSVNVVAERPVEGIYPAWLEPREIPESAGRRVFIDGRLIDPNNPHKEEQEDDQVID